jgi:hypothetical protein
MTSQSVLSVEEIIAKVSDELPLTEWENNEILDDCDQSHVFGLLDKVGKEPNTLLFPFLKGTII